MTHNEFLRWCKDREVDGLWYADIEIQCCRIVKALYSVPIWKRKQLWNKLNADNFIVNNYINPVKQWYHTNKE